MELRSCGGKIAEQQAAACMLANISLPDSASAMH
jgi:hypothetical protein